MFTAHGRTVLMSHEGIRLVSTEEAARETSRRPIAAAHRRDTGQSACAADRGQGSRDRLAGWPPERMELCVAARRVPLRDLRRRTQGRRPRKSVSPSRKPTALLPMYKPLAKPASAHAVGRYAMQFNWLDGHSAGIYSWDYLRRNCQCQECTIRGHRRHGNAERSQPAITQSQDIAGVTTLRWVPVFHLFLELPQTAW